MPPTLTHLATGRTVETDPDRVLIGSAEYADAVVPDAPYLAVVLVRYPSGWAAHALTGAPLPTVHGAPLRPGVRGKVRTGAVIRVGGHEFRFTPDPTVPPDPDPEPTPLLQLTVRGPDDLYESRSVDHDLLVGRLPLCDICFPHEVRLSRLSALFSADGGGWYAVTLSRGPIGRNRKRVDRVSALADGDEVQVGPLFFTVALRPAVTPPPVATLPEPPPTVTSLDDSSPTETGGPGVVNPGLHAAGMKLDSWLKGRSPAPATGGGVLGWVRGKVAATAEVTTARVHRAARRYREALGVLEPAVRANPGSEDLLRELYRLYRDAGLPDLCFRPLRTIEKAREAAGRAADAALLRDLAEVCRDLGPTTPGMFERALNYWQKLEAATGASMVAERNDTLARQAMVAGRYEGKRV